MKRLLVVVIWALCAASAWAQTVPSMTAHFIDIGQGESVLLEFSCGAMLIDAGAQDAAARTALVAYLNKFFARRTDLTRRSTPFSLPTITSTTILGCGQWPRTSPSSTTLITA